MLWFDARQLPDRINFDALHAIIFNVPSKSIIPLWNGRHWYTALKDDNGWLVLIYYNVLLLF